MPDAAVPVLVALTGLPGSGKTTLARELAARLRAVHVRVDVIETALEGSGAVSLAEHPELGYRIAYALAGDHLRSGMSVVADTVNPIEITRVAWRGVARDAGARLLEVEVVCSDAAEHRRRVEAREADIPGHAEPSWQDVVDREFEPLTLGAHAIRVDTARGIDAAIAELGVRFGGGADI
jgi:predicted kinase